MWVAIQNCRMLRLVHSEQIYIIFVSSSGGKLYGTDCTQNKMIFAILFSGCEYVLCKEQKRRYNTDRTFEKWPA